MTEIVNLNDRRQAKAQKTLSDLEELEEDESNPPAEFIVEQAFLHGGLAYLIETKLHVEKLLTALDEKIKSITANGNDNTTDISVVCDNTTQDKDV